MRGKQILIIDKAEVRELIVEWNDRESYLFFNAAANKHR